MWRPFAIAFPLALLALEGIYYLRTRFIVYHPTFEAFETILAVIIAVSLAVWWQPRSFSPCINIISSIVCAAAIVFSFQMIEIHQSSDGLSNSFAAYGSVLIKTRSDANAFAANLPHTRGRALYGFGREVFYDSHGRYESWLMFHVWPVILISAIPTACWGRQCIRSRIQAARAARNQCIHCGYDLQATPERCPECGAIVEPRENAQSSLPASP